uniref:ELM2 domain-containing protein n=1 Tax=Tanacetum cinerariifolium TaxID=118510 RepID=A0A6L2NGY0_TANCI|nr:hypothetical protein [Tanacetum cinerariifolium]
MLRKKNVEIEAKRIAEEEGEEEATNDKEEEAEETIDNVGNMEKDVEKYKEDVEATSADEEANFVEEQASEQADNEEDAEENDDVNQVLNNIQTMPFLNTTKRSNKNQVGKGFTKKVLDESLSEMNKEVKKKKKEEQIEKKSNEKTLKINNKRKLKEVKSKNPKKNKSNKKEMKCTGKTKKSGRHEKVNMKESDGEESEVEKHKEEIAKEEEENYSNSEDEEELKKVTKGKMEKGHKKPSKRVKYPTCSTRSSPKHLFDAMSDLSKERKRCLKQMGFERYIQFPIVELPSKLAYHVIENFHSPSMELRLQKGSIKATRQKVNDILGIPMGTRKFQDLEKRPDNDPFIDEWEAQYNHLEKPTPRAIALQMSGTTKADFMFKINFLTLLGSTMGTLENGGRVPKKLVKCIKEETDVSDIDWCGYILDCLRDKHHGDFDPDEDQNGIDLYKGFDVYIKPLRERKPVTKEYKKLFRDAEFNLYDSSMDEYSESESDADNNKKNDNEEASIADAKKKKEKEKRNDISKGTKEVGSEHKGDEEDVQDDLNNEHEFEKLTGDDREVAFLMEVDETENEKEKQTKNVKEQQEEKKEKQAEKQEKQDDIRKGIEQSRSETKKQ